MSQIPKAAVYTKKGDKGTTSLVDGQIVAKNSPRVEAYGDVDELNSVIGLVCESTFKSLPQEKDLQTTLNRIQNHLFNVGSLLATESVQVLSKLPTLNSDHVTWLEQEIDLYNHKLPQLSDFILPGGHEASAWCHLARTVCRRAERHVVALNLQTSETAFCVIYLNRLSDFFFTLARWVHMQTRTAEVKWDNKA